MIEAFLYGFGAGMLVMMYIAASLHRQGCSRSAGTGVTVCDCTHPTKGAHSLYCATRRGKRDQAGGDGLMASHASSDSDGGDGGGD